MTTRPPSQATRLVNLAAELFEFGRAADGMPFACPKGEPSRARLVHHIAGDLATFFAAQEGTVPNADALRDAMTVLQGKARNGDQRPDVNAQAGPCADDIAEDTIAAQLVRMAETTYDLGVGTSGEAYAVPKGGPHVARLLRGGRQSVRAELAQRFFDATGKPACASALADAMLVLEGKCQQAEPVDLALRVAELPDGRLVLDLGDDTGRVVVIGAERWQVEDTSPMLFRRTELTGPLPMPATDGDPARLWEILNIDKDDRPVLLAWLVSALMPDVPHPIPGLFGEQGCGKTTAGRVLSLLVDPGPVPVRKAPRDPESWVTAAAGSWVVCLDNLSDVSPWLSDSLCRAVTGDGDVRRQLYTDGQLVVFAFRRAVIITGIDVGAVRGDLADRLLPLDLHIIPEAERLEESAFWPRWDQLHPRLLGGLLDLAAEVLRVMPTVKLTSRPRMADYGRVLAAVDHVLGTSGLDRYRDRAGVLAADSLTGDPFVVAMTETLAEEFIGTSAELLAKLTPADERWRSPKGWPGNARSVTTVLKRQAPVMRRVGWTVDELGRGGHSKTARWAIRPPLAEEKAGNGCPQRPPRPHEGTSEPEFAGIAGNAGDDPAPSLLGGGRDTEAPPDVADPSDLDWPDDGRPW